MPPPTIEHIKQLWAVALGHSETGRLAEAEAAYRQVAALAPDHGGVHYNLAVTLRALGRLDEAAAHYRRTLALQPANAKAHNNLGVVLGLSGGVDEAISCYRRALDIQPDYAEAHFNLANALKDRGELARALQHYGRALAFRPDDPEILNNLAIAEAADGRTDAAVQHYRRAVALRPDYAEALSNLGSALADQGHTDEAMACYGRALALNPAYADARFNRAQALDAQDRMAEAEVEYALALALDPSHAEAHNNFGFLSQRLGRLDESLAHYDRAQTLKPGYAEAHWNESLARLLVGDFETGWRKYQWRWRRKDTPARTLPAPLWDGGDLSGRTVLLHAEQGLGDAIQFARYAPLVQARGGVVLFECQPSQMSLFGGLAGVDRLVAAGQPLPPFDVHAPLLDLPGLLDTRLDTVPAGVPYLAADPALVEAWRERLDGLTRPKVGLVWRGNRHHANDRNRSMSAAALATLVDSAEVDWVVLQIDARADERAAFGSTPMVDAGPLIGDWADTAALVETLDLVVTVDTSIAHLAGALGKPVWVMLPFAPDWRWMVERPDSPWYPTMRLFRQTAPGGWTPVLDAVGAALRRLSTGALPIPAAPALQTRPSRLPPAMVVSHERSGTHFLMNALSYGYGYTAEPWIDLDDHAIPIDYSRPDQIADALQARAGDPLKRIVKSHHAADQFAGELDRIAEDYRIFYVYRRPWAVMVSLWRHLNGLAWDEGPKAADPLALAQATPAGDLTRYQARPYPTMLQRWAGHVQGWLSAADADPRIVPVRYEDLDSRYEEAVAAFSPVVGRPPLSPMLRPPRDVNVIAMGKSAAEAPVSGATLAALQAYCRREAPELLARLGY